MKRDPANWKCECGSPCQPSDGTWLWTGRTLEHHHGYPRRESCEWQYDDGIYHTECNEAFVTNDGTVSENGIVYCCFCGGRIKELTNAK